MQIFEAIMMVCFGISWPVSIYKSIKTKFVKGKSPLFMIIVSLGYLSGIIYKVECSFDWVTFLYGINLLMVLTDLVLYYYYERYWIGKQDI